MKFIRPAGIVLLTAIPLLTLFSCKKLPETSFTYSPIENPEAGEYIAFENTTPEANSYEWDFGDGTASSQENPEHKFAEEGSFEVTLTATNDAGNQPKTESLTINAATILSLFILDSTGANTLSQAQVLVYDNEADWDAFENELESTTTNALGEAVFMNMESIVYYVWAYKEEAEGMWVSGGYTPAISLNETNTFSVPCIWVPNGVAKSAVTHAKPVQLLLR
jgi:PKD repeat protein